MKKTCLGQMQMDYHLYNRLPLIDIFDLVAGFFDLQLQHEKHAWERCRWQTAVLFNVQVGKKDKKTPAKMLPFPWDGENQESPQRRETPKLLTDEHQRKVAARMDRDMRKAWEEEQRKKQHANGISGS